MNKKYLLHKILPHVLVVVAFAIFSYAYFPIDFNEKAIQQSDIVNYNGAVQEILKYKKETGERTLWTNSMFGGMPAYGISTAYLGNKTGYLQYVLNPFGLKYQARRLFYSLLCFYILMVVLGVPPLLAAVGAAGFGLSTYFYIIEHVGHNSKAYAMSYMPLLLAGLVHVFKNKKSFQGAVLFAAGFALLNGAGHPQITYYTGLLVLCIGLVYMYVYFKQKLYKDFLLKVGLVTAFTGIAFFTGFNQNYTNYQYAKQTIRGKSDLTISPQGVKSKKSNQTSGLDRDYITAWSYGKMETLNLFIPGFAGVKSGYQLDKDSETYKYLKRKYGEQVAAQLTRNTPMYWGPQPFTEGPVYLGAVMVFLFILALVSYRGTTRKWVIAGMVLCLVLAWGKNFSFVTNLFIDHFPLYNKFRTVSMILVIAELLVPFFGVYGLFKLLQQDSKFIIESLKKAVYIAGGICVALLLFGGMIDVSGLNDAAYVQQYKGFGLDGVTILNKIQADRVALIKADALRSLIYVLLAATAVYFYVSNRKAEKVKVAYLFIALGVFIIADLWPKAKYHLNEGHFTTKSKMQQPFPVNKYDIQILSAELRDAQLKQKLFQKVSEMKDLKTKNQQYIALLQELNLHTNYRVLNRTKNVMSDASTSYLHKSLGGYSAVKLRKYQELWDFHLGRNNPSVINMLNAKYIIDNVDGQEKAQFNVGALGNAWFVQQLKFVDSEDEEILALQDFDPATTAILNKKYQASLANLPSTDSPARVVMTSYKPDEIRYKATGAGLAVFSEIFYDDGWEATVNGKPTDILKVNYLLRALPLAAGEHEIVFTFKPKMYEVGNTIDFTFSVLFYLLILFALYLGVRQNLHLFKPTENPSL